ncbi:hypothetical protein HK103_001673 [Boothiomyces macroporosus]|uniref:Uncharacterized protein n=1 Tax=Boothiomyces macroporosus TaxID=261099 RepID=A0AAD5UAI7_9FUNG|nr:hypothetical protein HK103_001673 [Boothiomyces macroporosus]
MSSLYKELKADFESLIDQCKQTKLENERLFQDYQSRVLKEFSAITKERTLFEDNWEKHLREIRLGKAILRKEIEVDEKEINEDSFCDSSNTLFTEDASTNQDEQYESEDDSQEFALNQLHSFHAQKTIKRKLRYKMHDKMRTVTVQSLGKIMKTFDLNEAN